MARVQGAAGKAVRILGRILPGQTDELLQGLFMEPTLGVGAGQSLNAAFLAMFHQSAGLGGALQDDVGLAGALLLGVRADGSLAATYTAFAAAGVAAIITPTFQPLALGSYLETGLASITYPVANVNLAVNGDFEDYPVSPGAPTGWTSTFIGATANRDTAIPYAGQNALRVQATQNNPSAGSIIQVLPALTAGATHYIVARHRTNGSPTAKGRLKIRNITDNVDVFNLPGTAGIQSYERLSFTTFVPLAGKTYQIELKFDNSTTTLNGDAVLWDNILVFQGPPDLNLGAQAAGALGSVYAAPGAGAQASGAYGTVYVGPAGGIAQAGLLTPTYAAPGAAATVPAGALGSVYAAPGAGATIPAAPIAITVNPFGAAGHLETGTLAVVHDNISPANLLLNPSFETYTTSPGAPDNWFTNQSSRVTLTKESSLFHCGLQACRMTRILDAASTPGIGEIVGSLAANTTYYFLAWVYPLSTATQTAGLLITDSAGTTLASFSSAALPLAAWTKMVLRFNVGSTPNKVYVVHGASGATLGDVLIADCAYLCQGHPADLGIQGTILPLNFQTGDRIASKDVFTRTDKTASICNEDTNRDAQDIRVQNFTGVSIRDGYVGWDLTGMPAGATLLGATLKVNVVTAPGAAADVDLYALANADEGWNETTLKCSTAPAASGGAMQRINFPASTGQKSFVLNATVLARLQARMGVGVATLLFRMVGTTINDDVTFDDKESGASVGPRLSLQFTT